LFTKNRAPLAQQFQILLPFPPQNPNKKLILSLINKTTTSQWKHYGSRAVYLQLFLDSSIKYTELKTFHRKLLILFYLYARSYPKVESSILFKSNKGLLFKGTRESKEDLDKDRDLTLDVNNLNHADKKRLAKIRDQIFTPSNPKLKVSTY
jgi:hypothetical protein